MKFLPNIILNFHAIEDEKWLEGILKIVNKLYNIVSYNEIEAYYYDNKKLKNACHITFDDGHISFYEKVFPLLKKYHVPASIFVSPKIIVERKNFWFQEINDYNFEVLNKIIDERFSFDYLGSIPVKAKLKRLKIKEIWDVIFDYQQETNTLPKSCVNMNLNQIKEIQQSGLVNIGAHTMNHPILKNEMPESLNYEIGNSIFELSVLFQTNIRSFAYPNGNSKYDFGEREIKMLKNNNIKLAFSTEIKSFSKNDNTLSVPRSGFEGGNKFYIYTKLLLGDKRELLKKIMNRKDEYSYRFLF